MTLHTMIDGDTSLTLDVTLCAKLSTYLLCLIFLLDYTPCDFFFYDIINGNGLGFQIL